MKGGNDHAPGGFWAGLKNGGRNQEGGSQSRGGIICKEFNKSLFEELRKVWKGQGKSEGGWGKGKINYLQRKTQDSTHFLGEKH